jgi:hypothetical protein
MDGAEGKLGPALAGHGTAAISFSARTRLVGAAAKVTPQRPWAARLSLVLRRLADLFLFVASSL